MFIVIGSMSTCALHLSNAYNLPEEYRLIVQYMRPCNLKRISPKPRFSKFCRLYTCLRMYACFCVDQVSVTPLRSELVYVASGEVLSTSCQADPVILVT